MSRIGIFGGTFDPIHVAHLIVAERVASERDLARVLFIPAREPPHKRRSPVASGPDRLRMVELATAGNPAFEALPIELEREGPSYTLMTVWELRRRMPADELFLILGGDSVRDVGSWWRAEELVGEVDVIGVDRPGAMLDDCIDVLGKRFGAGWAERTRDLHVTVPLLDVSATDIRARIRAGLSVRYLVPEPVLQCIAERGLYRSDAGGH